jgi:hypothetical protein
VDSKLGGRSILHVKEAEIAEITGHLGDFKVSLTTGGERHTWRASVICLTDENVLPLAIQENMMGLKKLYRYNFAFFHTPQLGLCGFYENAQRSTPSRSERLSRRSGHGDRRSVP